MSWNESWTGVRTLLLFSTRKLLLNRRWMLVAAVCGLVAVVMGYVASQEVDPLDGGSFLLETLVLSFLLPVLALIYGASMIRNEIDDRSITLVISSPLERGASYLAYYLALAVVLSLMMVAVGAVGWASFFAIGSWEEGAVDLLLSYSLLLVIGSVVYSSLFLAMGTVLRQPIYLGLLYAFVWEAFVGSLPGNIGQLTILHQLKVVGSELIPYGGIANTGGDPAASSLALIGLTVLLLILGALAFRRKEVP